MADEKITIGYYVDDDEPHIKFGRIWDTEVEHIEAMGFEAFGEVPVELWADYNFKLNELRQARAKLYDHMKSIDMEEC